MKKAAIVGVYGVGTDFTTGQAVKCYELINWMKKEYGSDNIMVVNTYRWKKNPIKLIIGMFKAFCTCKNVIIMPAQHGIKVFAPMAYYLNKLFSRQVHYVVIGGWLADMLRKNSSIKRNVYAFEGVYVETQTMVDKLKELGIENAFFMPNCRQLPDEISVINNNHREPLKVCTYSRVVKEKGILDAIEIVRIANQKCCRNIFKLDIYGKIDAKFKEEFEQSLNYNSSFVKYCGVKNGDEGINTLSSYFALLFPTFYEGEGFAGTILDAFAACTPVIANNWKYNSEILKNGVNGFLYSYRDLNMAADLLCELYHNKELVERIQEECKRSAKLYSTENVMREFSTHLKI